MTPFAIEILRRITTCGSQRPRASWQNTRLRAHQRKSPRNVVCDSNVSPSIADHYALQVYHRRVCHSRTDLDILFYYFNSNSKIKWTQLWERRSWFCLKDKENGEIQRSTFLKVLCASGVCKHSLGSKSQWKSNTDSQLLPNSPSFCCTHFPIVSWDAVYSSSRDKAAQLRNTQQ